MNYQIELLRTLLHDFIGSNSALTAITGEVLAVNGPQADVSGTLPMAGSIVGKYFKLEEGDVVLLNDPYSGGSTLNQFTFVVAVSDDLLWITRKTMAPRLSFEATIENEGLRIPPTPLRQGGKVNEAILQAMTAHPACPAGFAGWVTEKLQEILNHSVKLQKALEATGFAITSELIENYIQLSRKAAAQRINESAFGETRVDVYLDSGELLRLNMDIHDSLIQIDFGGTSVSKNIALTEAATYGVCLSAIGRFYGFNQIANSGSFSVVQVTKPSNCWLNAKYPAPVQKGHHNGIAALEKALDLALTQIHFKAEKSPDSHCSLKIEWRNAHASQVIDLLGGRGASSAKEGRSARVKGLSVEKLERDFPLQVLKVEKRSRDLSSKNPGGGGIELQVKVLGPVEALWMTDLTAHLGKLPKNCTAGEVSQILLNRSGKEQSLSSSGQQQFQTGDVLTFKSGSGGSFGKAPMTPV